MKQTATVIVGDNRQTLKQLSDQSVQTVITSPPYWGLRDYGTGTWIGGEESCSHRRETKKSDKTITGHKNFDSMLGVGDAIYKSECPRCGAIREDLQLGLEPTPADYIEELCQVFDEVWRVLKDDGTLWVNLGDSYFNKSLAGIPWRFAFAMQDRGWYLRQDIIWAKPNPMPESVTDRCTKSHEYIFLLTKSPKYYFDHEAIKESAEQDGQRNKRDVWSVAVRPYADAHFATYPAELITPCVLAASREGDLILDPFSGSGTTGEVALNHGRNYIGLELNPDYAKLSEKRLTNAAGMFGEVFIQEGNN